MDAALIIRMNEAAKKHGISNLIFGPEKDHQPGDPVRVWLRTCRLHNPINGVEAIFMGYTKRGHCFVLLGNGSVRAFNPLSIEKVGK